MSRGAVALAETGHTRTDVAGLAAADVRPGAPGVPVVLVPGYTGSKEDFGQVLDLLSPHRAVAVDQPGQFESPKIPLYTWDALARAVLGVVDAVGGVAHVVGHSFGGLVCAHAALERPEAFASLTLLDSGPGFIAGNRAVEIAKLLPVLAAVPMDLLFTGLVAGGYNTDTGISRAKWVGTDPQQLVQTAALLLGAPDLTEKLAASGIPVHVVCGVDDNAWPVPVQQDMARRLGTEAVLIPHAAHSPAIENPAATARALLTAFAGGPVSTGG